jgi:AAA15 family ATPase/GTPase
MLKSLKIENFRGFETLELKQFGRINLLVGENNCGKTSILEAIQLLCSRGNLEPLSQLMFGRGEVLINDERKLSPLNRREMLDVCHLFYGHGLTLDNKFTISSGDDRVECLIGEIHQQASLFDNDDDFQDLSQNLEMVLFWIFSQEREGIRFLLSPEGGVASDHLRRNRRELKNSAIKTQFVTSSSLTSDAMIELFDQIVLKPEEEIITKALQTIDPEIERIASVAVSRARYSGRTGFKIRRSGTTQPVPIGSMGDGIWRMLGLSLAAACTKDGVLLVDEIDTGLHYSAMSKMWKMIWETAKQSNVQVFATTHSRDCWESLAEIAKMDDAEEEEGITIHRVEKGRDRTTLFDTPMIVAAAEREIEVR